VTEKVPWALVILPAMFIENVPASLLVELTTETVLDAGSNDMNDVLCPAVAGVTIIEYTISLAVQNRLLVTANTANCTFNGTFPTV
jgi:hypothetical protein